jgi:pyruvate/2-oxoglutarate dehydrogenase complex dihydrolipoamide dehydrogenase (E3) component/sugar lactone lactonase YvrE
MTAMTTPPVPVPCSATPGLLSEGPRWNAGRDELLWVDIIGSRLHRGRLGPDSLLDQAAPIQFDRFVGAVAPAVGGGYVLAAAGGFLFADGLGTVRELAQPEAGRSNVRMNDGACDPQGRFWAGTMAHDETPGMGVLYRLELDGTCTTVLTGLTISNGIGWSPDGSAIYLSDSGTRRIDAFDFDASTGDVGRRRTIARITEPGVAPDGLTVDERGDIWVALWGGGAAVLQPGGVAACHRPGSGAAADVLRVRGTRPSDAVHHDRPPRTRPERPGATAGRGTRVPSRRPRRLRRAVRALPGTNRAAPSVTVRLLVLGGGPAGVNAALQARELGAEVILVEAKQVGGTSLNDGPAPVRTLARAARLIRDAKSWERLGLRGANPQIDITAALASARRIADYVHDQQRMADALRRLGIDLVDGVGPSVFIDSHTVRIADGREFRGDAVVVAVGGHAGRLPIPGVELGLTYEGLRDLTALPTSAVVVGGADTGCQLASILADFGVDVTLIEAGPRLVTHADEDVSDSLATSFSDRGILVKTSTLVERLERTAAGIRAHHRSTTQQGQLDVDAVFLAVGWPRNADVIGAAGMGIGTERGYVTVDDDLRSSLPHVFAAGDVNGISMLVPSARLAGRIAAENAVLGTRRRFMHELVPTGSFTDPEYGGVGLTEAQARERYDCEVGWPATRTWCAL